MANDGGLALLPSVGMQGRWSPRAVAGKEPFSCMSRTQERERARLMEGTTAEGGDEPRRGLGVGPGRLVMGTPSLQGRPPMAWI